MPYWDSNAQIDASSLAAPYIKPTYVCETDYYVFKSGSDSNDGASPKRAWLTIQHAVDALGIDRTHGGVCVNVGPGLYSEHVYKKGFKGDGDSQAGYVVFRSTELHGAKVQMPTKDSMNPIGYGAFRFDEAEYIIVDGFEIEGHVVDGAQSHGISFNSFGGPGHHIKVLNNVVHHNGGAGIAAVHTDYFVVEGNKVYGNANTSYPFQNSGITLWQAVAADNRNGFHNVIGNNIVFGNAVISNPDAHSDGNGIIIDDFRNTQAKSGYGTYRERTLVENNLVFSNGGFGIHVFLSDHVTMQHNTVAGNMWDRLNVGAWRGEISVQQGSYNVVVNNIAVANPGTNSNNRALISVTSNGTNLNNTWKNNLTFNGTKGQASTYVRGDKNADTMSSADGNLLGVNPLFVNMLAGRFSLESSSPAINTGTDKYGNPDRDLAGNRRPRGAGFDLGAYEWAPPPCAPPCTVERK